MNGGFDKLNLANLMWRCQRTLLGGKWKISETDRRLDPARAIIQLVGFNHDLTNESLTSGVFSGQLLTSSGQQSIQSGPIESSGRIYRWCPTPQKDNKSDCSKGE